MGTTIDAIKTGHVKLCTCVTIGGYNRILTDAEDDHLSSVVTAYAAADSAVQYGHVRGLQVEYSDLSQQFTPWSSDFKPTQIRILVDDGDGEFGQVIHKRASDNDHDVTEAVDTTETTIDVKNGGDFSGLSNNTLLWIDNECVTFSSQTATTVTVNHRGMYAPFKAESESNQRWAQVHDLPAVGFDVAYKSQLTQNPRRWVGRHVAVRLHRVTGSTIDTYDQAHLIFAGVIDDIRDTSSGRTEIVCSDFRKVINEAVILRDQYKALPEEGMYIPEGWVFRFQYWDDSAGTRTSVVDSNEQLTVVASGAGTNEINAGYYTAGELAAALTRWAWNDVSTYAKPKPIFDTTYGKTTIHVPGSAQGDTLEFIAPPPIFDLFGYTDAMIVRNNTDAEESSFIRGLANEDDEIWIVSTEAPLSHALPVSRPGDNVSATMELAKGTWINQAAYMPEPWKSSYNMSGGDWGVVKYGERYYVANYTNDTTLTLYADDDLQAALHGTTVRTAGAIGQRTGEADILVEQVIFIERTWKQMLGMLFLATDGADYNDSSSTYDVLPLGAAIPHELLGDTFLDSIDAVAGATAGGLLTVLIEKPTKLGEIIGPDMILRQCDLVFDPADGAYRLTLPITPSSTINSSFLTSLTESNKGAPIGQGGDAQRTTTEITSTYLRNVIKVLYNRTSSRDQYRDSATIVNQASVNALGGQRAVTIKARNTWGGTAVSDTISSLASSIAANLLPLLGEPLKIYRRTINQTLCDLVPGDLVLLTDDYVRDPATGDRGVTNQPGVVWASHWTPGGSGEAPTGEVQIIFDDFDRARVFSPVANVDDTATNGGYNAGTKTLTLYASHYSDASEAADASHFEVGDEVYVIERGMDFSSPSVFWTDTVAGVSGNTITLTTGDSGTWDSSLYYRVFTAPYNEAQSSQQDNHSYIADDADGQILDTADAHRYGTYQTTVAVTASAWDGPTIRPEYMNEPEYTGEGEGITPAGYLNFSRFVSNMNAYRCVQQFAFLNEGTRSTATNNTTYESLLFMPVNLGTFPYQQRLVTLAPVVSNSSGSDAGTLRITFAREPRPKSGLQLTGITMRDPNVSQTWTIAAGDDRVIQTAKTVNLLAPSQPDQPVYMHVEWLGGGSGTCTFWGLAKAWVGAPQ